MKQSFLHLWKNIALLMFGLFVCSVGYYLNASAATATPEQSPPKYQQFGEWRYTPQSSVPTLMWWNQRMPMVPVLYISFLPDRIILNATTPVWPDTGIIFYIRQGTDKLGLNLTLKSKDQEHCYYSATIYGKERQVFVNKLVTLHKARLITPSSYSQSLSLKHVYRAMQVLLSSHPKLQLTLPDASLASK